MVPGGAQVDILIRKVLGRPIGIWLGWLALAYIAFAGFSAQEAVGMRSIIMLWAILLTASVMLMRRRLIALTFAGMAFALFFREAVMRFDVAGLWLMPIGFVGMLANRRWFDERMPRIGR